MPGGETNPRPIQGLRRKSVVVGAVDLARAKIRVRGAPDNVERIRFKSAPGVGAADETLGCVAAGVLPARLSTRGNWRGCQGQ